MTTNKRLSATITIGGAVSGSLSAAFGTVNGKLEQVGKTVTSLTKRQKLLGKAIQEFGRTGKDVDGLRASYARLSDQIDRARKAQDRLARAQKFSDRSSKIGGALRGAATESAIGGAAIGGILYTGIRAAVSRENAVNLLRNSGATKQEQDEMIAAAQSSKQFGVSATEATKTVGELRASLGSATHAIEALPTALQAISGLQVYNRMHAGGEIGNEAAYALAKIADERGGAIDPATMRTQMNWAFKAITGTQGKLSADDLLTAQRGAKAAGVAATDEAFFGDTFLMQALGAPGYGKALSTLNNAWIGGHQDKSHLTNMLKMGLLDPSKVKLKNGLVNEYSPEALVDHALFIQDQQKWVEKYLVPLAQKRGINLNDDAAVQAFAASITSNTNATNVIFQRLKNRVSIDRDRANVLRANGISESDSQNKNSTAGRQENVRARLDDAENRVGTILLPAFASAMEKTADVLERVNKFADENPRLMKGIVTGLGGLAVGLVALSPVLLVANGILKSIALVRLARAAAEVTSLTRSLEGVTPAAATASSGILGFVGKLGVAVGLVGVALAAAKALGLPDVDNKQGIDDIKNGRWLAASAHLPALDFLRAMTARAGGKSDDEISSAMASGRNPNDKAIPGAQPSDDKQKPAIPTAPGKPLPPVPAPSVKSQPAITQSLTFGDINITQQPGQDSTAMAKEIMLKMQKMQAAQSRSIMFDGASQ